LKSRFPLGGTKVLRILLLNYEFPPLGGGGGQIAANFCRYLAAFGHEVQVHTSGHASLPAREIRDGYTIVRSFALRQRLHTCTVPEMAAYLALTLGPTLKHVRLFKPEVIHVHFAVPSGVIAWIIHRLTGIPYLLSAHLGDVPGGVPEQTDHLFKWIKPLTFPIWKAAAAVTVPATHIRHLARQHYDVPIEVIHNGLDLSAVETLPAPPSTPVRLLFAGRLSIQKNPLFLLESLAQVKQLPWRLDILGDGPLWVAAQNLAIALGLDSKVLFHGWVTPEQVQATMAASDILVLPSLSEGLPLVGVQALAAGLAILGTHVGGISDLVQSGQNGFLVPVNDKSAFADRLHFMLDHQVLAGMKLTSRQLAQNFDLTNLARRLEHILQLSAASSPKPG
jgi:glycosyltransferase involved in cell wall biosynthesis